jgi:hypothetical protein
MLLRVCGCVRSQPARQPLARGAKETVAANYTTGPQERSRLSIRKMITAPRAAFMSAGAKNWEARIYGETHGEMERCYCEVREMFPTEGELYIRRIAQARWLKCGLAAGLDTLASGAFAPDVIKQLNELIERTARAFAAAKPPVEAIAARDDLTTEQREFLHCKVLTIPFLDYEQTLLLGRVL